MKIQHILFSLLVISMVSCSGNSTTKKEVTNDGKVTAKVEKEEPISGSDAELLEKLKADKDIARLYSQNEQSKEIFTELVHAYGSHGFMQKMLPCEELATSKMEKTSLEYKFNVTTCKQREIRTRLEERYKSLLTSDNMTLRKRALSIMAKGK